jgi:hypothetical protein
MKKKEKQMLLPAGVSKVCSPYCKANTKLILHKSGAITLYLKFLVFVEAGSCNKLNFHLGTNAIGLAKVDTRSWSLKVTFSKFEQGQSFK